MEISGKIILELPLQEGVSKAGNPWKKKEWVMEVSGQYPRKVKFHVFGDRADTMNFVVGNDYVLSVDIESREFNGRWYTDVSCYGMHEAVPGNAAGGSTPPPVLQEPQAPFGQSPAAAAPADPFAAAAPAPDDLPF